MKISAPIEEQHKLEPEETIDNKLEILRFASQVQSRIKNDISEDFILAKLEQKDKEGITEMTSNAYFMKKILVILRDKSRRWKWNPIEKTWQKEVLQKTEKDFITGIADATFDSYLTRIYMTVILNRNVAGNHLLKILAGVQDDDETDKTDDMVKHKISELLVPNEEIRR